jgi:hypothetical protein
VRQGCEQPILLTVTRFIHGHRAPSVRSVQTSRVGLRYIPCWCEVGGGHLLQFRPRPGVLTSCALRTEG